MYLCHRCILGLWHYQSPKILSLMVDYFISVVWTTLIAHEQINITHWQKEGYYIKVNSHIANLHKSRNYCTTTPVGFETYHTGWMLAKRHDMGEQTRSVRVEYIMLDPWWDVRSFDTWSAWPYTHTICWVYRCIPTESKE